MGAKAAARGTDRRAMWSGALMMAAVLTTVSSAEHAWAQDGVPQVVQPQQRDFDIPPQPLTDALAQFGRQSGMQVSVDAGLIRDVASPGVRGAMAPEQALDRLLAGTGITYRLTDDNTAMLQRSQTGAAETEPTQLPPILVEAAKRGPEDIQRIPGSAYAYGAQELEDSRTRGIEGVLRQTPNTYFEERSNGDVIINLRGNSTRNNNTDASVGLYVDGAYNYIQGNNNNIPLFDIDQVNVLLGPQGGLYGRNAVGGAINIQTANPTDQFEVEAGVEAGNFNSRRVDAMVNAPVADGRLRFRVAGFYDERDSYFFNRTRGRDEEGAKRRGGRFKVGVTPDDDWDLVFGVERIEQNLPGTALTPADDLDVSIGDIIGRTDRNSTRFSNSIEWTPSEWLTIRSITGLSLPDGRLVSDGDGTSNPVASITNEFEATQFNQELRFSSPDDVEGPFSWVVGFNYFRDSIDTRQDTVRLADGRLDRALIDGRIEQFAVFGEATYEILPDLRLTGTLRYSHEEKDVSVLLRRRNAGSPVFATLFANDTVETYQRVNPGAALSYDWTDSVMTYAKVATAYKSGGVNFAPTPTPENATFDPEDVISFEVGAKTQWFDDRLIVNGALFHQKQKDFQLRTRTGTTSFFSNVGDGITNGAELSVRALPAPGFDLAASYGYLAAEFDDAPAVQVSLPPAGAAAIMDVSGNRIPDVPTHTFNLAATYRSELGPWVDGFIRGEYYMTHGGYADAANLFELDPKSSVNLSAGIEGDQFQLAVFVNNLLDEEYFEVTPTFGAPAVGQRNVPRTFGVSASLRW